LIFLLAGLSLPGKKLLIDKFNIMDKFFAIGDIHGCFDKLYALMNKIEIDFKKDTLIFLGDYIDRGPDSFKVIEYLINLKKKCKNLVFLKGNHEELLENYLKGVERFNFLYNGGQQTLESYMKANQKPSDAIPEKHLEFFDSLEYYYETEKYIFVHAGLKANVLLAKQKTSDLLWIRREFINSKYDFGRQVVFGHTVFETPLLLPNKIGIDTGAAYGRKLTCVKLPDLLFYDV